MGLAAILAMIQGAASAAKALQNLISILRGKAVAAGATDADVQAAIDAAEAKVDNLDTVAAEILARLLAEGKIPPA